MTVTKNSTKTLSNVMTANPLTLRESSTISYAIQLFDRFKCSIAPVVNENEHLVGIISKNDLFHTLAQKRFKPIETFENILVQEIMNKNDVISLPKDATVEKAAEIMLENHLHHIFVTDSDKEIIGVVSSYDMMKILK